MPPKSNLMATAIETNSASIEKLQTDLVLALTMAARAESGHSGIMSRMDRDQARIAKIETTLSDVIEPALEEIPIISQKIKENDAVQAKIDALFTEVKQQQDANAILFARLNADQSQTISQREEEAVVNIAKKAVANILDSDNVPNLPTVNKRLTAIENANSSDSRRNTLLSDKSKLVVRGVHHNGDPFEGLLTFLPPALVHDIYMATVSCTKLVSPGSNSSKSPLCFEFINPRVMSAFRGHIRDFLKNVDNRSSIPQKLSLDVYTPRNLIPERKRVLELGANLKSRLGGVGGPVRLFKALVVNQSIVLQIRAKADIETENDRKHLSRWAQIPAGMIESINDFSQIKFEPIRATSHPIGRSTNNDLTHQANSANPGNHGGQVIHGSDLGDLVDQNSHSNQLPHPETVEYTSSFARQVAGNTSLPVLPLVLNATGQLAAAAPAAAVATAAAAAAAVVVVAAAPAASPALANPPTPTGPNTSSATGATLADAPTGTASTSAPTGVDLTAETDTEDTEADAEPNPSVDRLNEFNKRPQREVSAKSKPTYSRLQKKVNRTKSEDLAMGNNLVEMRAAAMYVDPTMAPAHGGAAGEAALGLVSDSVSTDHVVTPASV